MNDEGDAPPVAPSTPARKVSQEGHRDNLRPPSPERTQELLALLRELGPAATTAALAEDGPPPDANESAAEHWAARPTIPPLAYGRLGRSATPPPLIFNYTPQEIKEHLDEYVIGQDEAKKALAIGICEHYGRLKAIQEDPALAQEHYQKQNILLLGPSGVGKTYLVKTLAKLIGVPFVKADANRFTETGFVGANADDLIRDLVQIADGNIERAQYGIVYLDEADKLAGHQDASDIAHRGVQNALLKLMEDSEIDLLAGHDMASQLQSFMEFQKEGKVSRKIISTKYILFIVSGAFEGLADIIKRRCHLSTINLNSPALNAATPATLYQQVTAQDLIKYGLGPEFVGRLPIRVACQDLTVEDYEQILRHSRGSILQQYRASFAAYSVEIHFTDKAIAAMALMAAAEKTGARALVTIMDRILRDFKFYLPSLPINYFVVTEGLLANPQFYLDFMRQHPLAFDRANFQEILGMALAAFNQQQHTTFRFAPATVAFLYHFRRPRPQLYLTATKILHLWQAQATPGRTVVTPTWAKAAWDEWHGLTLPR